MDWGVFSSKESSKELSFESLCDQLFEKWCYRSYSGKIASFEFHNGSGGDGGVESVATLTENMEIGLQAKWFLDSLTPSRLRQIKESIITAKNNRPFLKRYIVAIPRDLAPKKANSKNPESAKWSSLVTEMEKRYPDLELILWTNSMIEKELQESENSGIYRYWFENSGISQESFHLSLEKSQDSWLRDRYCPTLNVCGRVDKRVRLFLGDEKIKNEEGNRIKSFLKGSSEVISLIDDLSKALAHETVQNWKYSDDDLQTFLANSKKQMVMVRGDAELALQWLNNEFVQGNAFSQDSLFFDFASNQAFFSDLRRSTEYSSFCSLLVNYSSLIENSDLSGVLKEIEFGRDKNPLIVVGNPGTGKTQGIAAVSFALFSEGIHTPVLINAKDFDSGSSWKDIIVKTLGLSDGWDEISLFNALSSYALRLKSSKRSTMVIPKILIAVDAIDEAKDIEHWKTLIKQCSAITKKYPLIRFCFTSRPWVFNEKEWNNSRIVKLPPEGDADFSVLFRKYIKANKIQIQNPDIMEHWLSDPFSLKLFCELYQGGTISPSSVSEYSLSKLIHKKIAVLDQEFSQKEGCSLKDGLIFKIFSGINKLFFENRQISREEAINSLGDWLSAPRETISSGLDFLEKNEILESRREEKSDCFAPDKFIYFSGSQNYLDYAYAKSILDHFSVPEKIDFSKIKIWRDSLRLLAVMSMENFDYLIVKNQTLKNVLSEEEQIDLGIFALKFANQLVAPKFRGWAENIMHQSPRYLRMITNGLVLPLSNVESHPLGVKLLDEYLNSFSLPAERDRMWSLPDNLYESPYGTGDALYLKSDRFSLTESDLADGLPVVYAWGLSSLTNEDRQYYRVSLLRWGLKKPLEFFKLFKHFSSVNDPQIKSDMMSILMCLNFEDYSRTILKVSADWVIRNVLAPEKRDSNRNVAIRYFSISILREAIREGLVREEVAKPYLPPFQSLNFSIPMNRNASEKATTDGYGGFDYDLCRYVLCDSITNRFDLFSSVSQKEITSFLEQVQKQQDNFPVLSPNRFILSAAYQFVLLNGWKKEDGERKGDLAGVDSCILRYYREEDHGSQSPVMSIHEKYIWQAREEILGFLSDHLPVSSDQVAKYVTDYGEIESFVIPSEERLFVPSQEAPLLMPETYASFGQNVAANKDEVVKTIFDFPGVDWKGLLFRDNHVRECELLGNELMSIYAYSSFGDDQNMQTTLFVISLILDQSNLGKLLEIFQSKAEDKTANSIDLEALKGGVVCNCYVSPYEICWCPWKERFESWKLNDLFPDINLVSAVDGCVSNLPNVGDIFWELPSKCLRDLLSIEFFDGQFFRAKDFTPEILLEKRSDINGNNQSMLLGNKDQILSLLSKKEQTMVFLMKEQRTPSPLSQERFGSFFARKNILSIGYFSGGNFHVKKISEVQNEN